MDDIEELNDSIDTRITDKTATGSVSTADVGGSIKDVAQFAKDRVDALAEDVADKADAADLAGKANIASPTFTGDAKASTPAAGDNDTSVATTAFVNTEIALAKPYKEVVFTLDQPNSGVTNMVLLQNDFTGVTISDVGNPGQGLYVVVSNIDVFTEGKTTIVLGPGSYNANLSYRAQRQSANQICVFQYYSGSLSSGNFMDELTVSIRVYP